ncbi:hypothetical protein [Chlorogloeopsis sp. ULAP02]|uniref:hypothetical protein n=1 Tax=Chlorogloeopsis sp. ULAP02 TaxID=3107926 RepID=UPI003136CC80
MRSSSDQLSKRSLVSCRYESKCDRFLYFPLVLCGNLLAKYNESALHTLCDRTIWLQVKTGDYNLCYDWFYTAYVSNSLWSELHYQTFSPLKKPPNICVYRGSLN